MPTATPNPFDELFGKTEQPIPTQEQSKPIITSKEPIAVQEVTPKDAAPKSKYDYTPEKSNRKIIMTIFADKNEGKSYLALSLGNRGNPKDKIFAISFDHKTQPVKDLIFPDLDNVVVHDGTKYYDRSNSKAWLDSSVDSLEYIYSLIKDECGRLKPDWILFDAMETFYTMTEMAMRCNHNLQPYEGIQNRNIWKQRRMFLQHAHDLALRYAEKGVIYSIPHYSPIVISDSEERKDVISLEDLWNSVDSQIFTSTMADGNIAEYKNVTGIKLPYTLNPTGIHWSKVSRIIRHKYNGELVRLISRHGFLDTSPNHSVIAGEGSHPVDAKTLKVGDVIYSAPFNIGNSNESFIGSEDYAWLLGFFVAEGSAYRAPRCDGTNKSGNYCIQFVNQRKDLIEKVLKITKEVLNLTSKIYYREQDKCYIINFRNKEINKYFRSILYTSDGSKKVPKIILNAPLNIKRAFFDGYYVGDGCNKTNLKYYPIGFTTNSHVLAQGILVIAQEIFGVDWSIYDNSLRVNAVQIKFNKAKFVKDRNEKIRAIKSIQYNGYIYDLETEDHTFPTGIGCIKVHNTTYTTMKGRIIDADGQLVDAKEVPKWYGVMLLESDVVIRTYARIIKDEIRFFARIEGSKVSLFKTGDERDVTNIGIQAFFEPKIGQPKPQTPSASLLPTQILQPVQSQTTSQKSAENLGF